MEAMVQRISEHAKLDSGKVMSLISEKQDELSGLVSAEGAAYIVARELGLNMIRETRKQLKVKNLVSGLRSVDLVARVVRVFDEREFEREGKKGSVINMILGDETGTVRLSLWNEETAPVRKGKIKEGVSVRVSGGWVKTDNRDNPELRLGRGTIDVVDQVIELPERQAIEESSRSFRRSDIRDFREGGQYETRAALVQVFSRNPFFTICPECESRVKENEGRWVCDDHGEVKPRYALVVSGIIDDGTDNIRAVFFRELGEKLFGKTTPELREISEKSADSLSVFEHVQALGKEFIFSGRVKRNSFTENMEFMVNSIDEVDVVNEASVLLDSLRKPA